MTADEKHQRERLGDYILRLDNRLRLLDKVTNPEERKTLAAEAMSCGMWINFYTCALYDAILTTPDASPR
jgi:hypothetical protein